MTDDATPEPGWYPDPDGGAGQRYWDGAQWTDRAPARDEAGTAGAPATAGESPAAAAAPRPWHHKKRFMLPLGVAVGLLLGLAVGAGADGAEPAADADELREEIAELEAEVEALEEQLAAAEEAAAAAQEEAEAVADEDAADEPDPGDEPHPADEEEVAEGEGVGDTVAMGDLEHTLHGARWSDGDEFIGPDDGERWLVLDIELDNVGDDSAAISSMMMWDLVDAEHRTKDIAITGDEQGSLDGELGAGRQMRGEIAFSVGEDETAWELIFAPEVFGFGQAIYEIDEGDVD